MKLRELFCFRTLCTAQGELEEEENWIYPMMMAIRYKGENLSIFQ
jgi:hypothetical protein